jgi:ribosomal protein L37AE/L43A
VGRHSAILDDAGTPFTPVRLHTLRWDRRQSDPAFAAVVHRLARARVAEVNHAQTLAPVLLFCFGGGLSVVLLMDRVSPLLCWLAWVLPALGLRWLLVRSDASRLARQGADLLLADGICPGCAYNLSGLPVAAELVVCPECGASWHGARIARRHDFGVHASPAASHPARLWWDRVRTFEAGGPTSIFDARSYNRPIVSARLVWPIRTAVGERRDRLVEARTEMLTHGRGTRVFLGIILPVALLAYMWLLLRPGLSTGEGWLLAFCVVVALQAPITNLRGTAGVKDHHIRDTMLRRGLCPSCAADLRTPTAGDRLWVCPDCGAAWRVAQGAPPASPAPPDGNPAAHGPDPR